MKYEIGDILKIKKGYIFHQVNCMRVAGAGLAKQVADKYPEWLRMFRSRVGLLGFSWSYKPYFNVDLYIVSLYAQSGYGRVPNKVYTNYEALNNCLLDFKTLFYNPVLPVYAPYGMGSGLAGGSWENVKHLLGVHFPDITIVKLEKGI